MHGIPKALLKSQHAQNVADTELTQFKNVNTIYINLKVKKWKNANLTQNTFATDILKANV
jgi:hypothetical protein